MRKVIACLIVLNMFTTTPTYAEEVEQKDDSEVQELLDKYEENLREMAKLAEQKKEESEAEVFEPKETSE